MPWAQPHPSRKGKTIGIKERRRRRSSRTTEGKPQVREVSAAGQACEQRTRRCREGPGGRRNRTWLVSGRPVTRARPRSGCDKRHATALPGPMRIRLISCEQLQPPHRCLCAHAPFETAAAVEPDKGDGASLAGDRTFWSTGRRENYGGGTPGFRLDRPAQSG